MGLGNRKGGCVMNFTATYIGFAAVAMAERHGWTIAERHTHLIGWSVILCHLSSNKYVVITCREDIDGNGIVKTEATRWPR